ncbi:copper(I)-binding protein [Microbacteriaceae bacterium SG_E_30_P1]|uniref:Copper(I)-binding protein n=1 Tax=Antiquaquibacter oligotrophicus TaxID=2880260 RepID=A0ABT6KL03_9MICO|nr:copper chaperone PCu(A)C [Antiquaquibacter oligotrophicus]MDH6179859.1 copper(I)-binding protein [Antiquaquibacter oligotrophicus]UDF14380.1 copper chaperone PCu(A)C [Antiquaquibacter oligotrophicus]
MNTKTTSTLAAVAVALLALAGCAPASEAPESAAPQADSVVITDAWVKSAEEGMSAAFGILENSGSADATIVSATTAASPMIELHETVENDSGEMVMQEKDGGFVIPAGSSFPLEPGANHIMLMGLTGPLAAGEEVEFTLTFADGSEYTFTAPVKDYSGANENYEGDGMEMDGGMDMGQ